MKVTCYIVTTTVSDTGIYLASERDARIFITSRKALAFYRIQAKRLANQYVDWEEVVLERHTIVGSPRSLIGKAIQVGGRLFGFSVAGEELGDVHHAVDILKRETLTKELIAKKGWLP